MVMGGCALSAHAQPDYNRDCVADFNDSLAFMADFAARSMNADLNLDGAVNQTDFDLFADSRAKTNFKVYWQVSTSHQRENDMDTITDLGGAPVERACEMLYEREFPKYPGIFDEDGRGLEYGFHLMFRDSPGVYTNWRQRYDQWMAEHIASLPALMRQGIPANFTGIICIDWETTVPMRPLFGIDPEGIEKWDRMVESINSPNLSQSFLDFVGWTRPAGATRWADLTEEQRTDLYNASFKHVGMDFFITTARECKRAQPLAKVGFYGLPYGAWPVYDDARRAINDEMRDLWRAIDVLQPGTYPLYWTTNNPSESPCPEAVNTVGQNAAFYRAMMDEMFRIKREHTSMDQLIVPYASWHYKAQAGSCSPDIMPGLFCNQVNVNHQVQIPWWFGADGVAIWGHYGNYPPAGPDTPEVVGADLREKWTPLIRRLTCPR